MIKYAFNVVLNPIHNEQQQAAMTTTTRTPSGQIPGFHEAATPKARTQPSTPADQGVKKLKTPPAPPRPNGLTFADSDLRTAPTAGQSPLPKFFNARPVYETPVSGSNPVSLSAHLAARRYRRGGSNQLPFLAPTAQPEEFDEKLKLPDDLDSSSSGSQLARRPGSRFRAL